MYVCMYVCMYVLCMHDFVLCYYECLCVCMYVCMYIGGVFGNRRDWIGRAIGRAVATAEKQTDRGGRLGRHIKVSLYSYHLSKIDVCMYTSSAI